MDLDDVVASFQVYHHISNISEFQKWLNEYHKIADSNPFFLGYRYFLEICAIRIVDEIAESHFLELDEDETFLFANEDRIRLDEIPNSCDKIIVIKNIWLFFKPIKNAQNWAELNVIIHAAKHIPKIFEEIFNCVKVNEKNSKKNVINLITLHYVHIHFNDTQRLKPLGQRSD